MLEALGQGWSYGFWGLGFAIRQEAGSLEFRVPYTLNPKPLNPKPFWVPENAKSPQVRLGLRLYEASMRVL